eukprot:1625252-Prymnesium_polylepis.1
MSPCYLDSGMAGCQDRTPPGRRNGANELDELACSQPPTAAVRPAADSHRTASAALETESLGMRQPAGVAMGEVSSVQADGVMQEDSSEPVSDEDPAPVSDLP